MNRTTADITEFSVPADDGGIAQALAVADEKLAAWVVAMRETQRHIVGAAARAVAPVDAGTRETEMREPATAGDAAVETPTNPAATDVVPQDAQTASEGLPESVCHGPPAGPTQAGRLCHNTGETPVPHEESPPIQEIHSDTVTAPQEEPAASAPVAAPEDPTASPKDAADEALLASLDPETARTIRVMRRVSPIPESVEELLQEYEAGLASTPPAEKPKRKSWFSRG
ncbi:MAG TPA: hypothetical protein VLM89_13650 [Phycisphaerae bacterium]|nr:hypothetical protein [Phycisphaerae bacterium]